MAVLAAVALAATGCLAEVDPDQSGLNSEAGRCRPCDSEVNVEIIACGSFDISCNRDLSNIVYRVDGVDTKIDGLTGHNFTLDAEDVTDIWVKCGNNASGDGPGYGERVMVDDSDECAPNEEMCLDAPDCPNTLICGEGGICATFIGGRMFVDQDGNGTFGAGDTIPARALVRLQIDIAGTWTNVAADLIDASGFYGFTSTPTFEHRVTFEAFPGDPAFVFTTQDAGADDTIDSDADALGITGTVTDGYDLINPTVWAGVLP